MWIRIPFLFSVHTRGPNWAYLITSAEKSGELYYQVAKATLTASRFDFDTCYEIWIDHREHYGPIGVKRWEEHIMMQQKPVHFTTWFLFQKYIPCVLPEEHLYNELTWIECQLNKAVCL